MYLIAHKLQFDLSENCSLNVLKADREWRTYIHIVVQIRAIDGQEFQNIGEWNLGALKENDERS